MWELPTGFSTAAPPYSADANSQFFHGLSQDSHAYRTTNAVPDVSGQLEALGLPDGTIAL